MNSVTRRVRGRLTCPRFKFFFFFLSPSLWKHKSKVPKGPNDQWINSVKEYNKIYNAFYLVPKISGMRNNTEGLAIWFVPC